MVYRFTVIVKKEEKNAARPVWRQLVEVLELQSNKLEEKQKHLPQQKLQAVC